MGSTIDASPDPAAGIMSPTPSIASVTSPELASAAPWCLLVPLGATEQHGPHLPLATDTIIANRWALAAAAKLTGVVVAPPLPYGSSGEHQGFHGTISIGQDALRQVLLEIARSVRSDYRAIVFVSGHGGNAGVLRDVVSQLRVEGHVVDWMTPRFDSDEPDDSETVGVTDAHAGRTETSLMLYLRSEFVAPFDEVDGNNRPLAELMPTLRSSGLGAVTASGVLGDPSEASRSHGEILFGVLVTNLVHTIRRLENGKMRS